MLECGYKDVIDTKRGFDSGKDTQNRVTAIELTRHLINWLQLFRTRGTAACQLSWV